MGNHTDMVFCLFNNLHPTQLTNTWQNFAQNISSCISSCLSILRRFACVCSRMVNKYSTGFFTILLTQRNMTLLQHTYRFDLCWH